MVSFVIGRGLSSPRVQENFRKFAKNFVRKLQKLHYFNLIVQKLKTRLIFVRLDEKHHCWEILWEKFENLLFKI